MAIPGVRRIAASAALVLILLPAAAVAQSQVYVLDGGSFGSPCPSEFCFGPRIHLVSATTGHTLARIDVTPGEFPRGTSLGLSSDGSRLYVTAHRPGFNGELLVVDAISKRLASRVTVGLEPTDVAILPDSSRAYVVNAGSNSVSVVDLTSLTVISTITVGSSPARAVVSPNGSSVFVTNRGSNAVSRIATGTDTVAATIPVGTSPSSLDISAVRSSSARGQPGRDPTSPRSSARGTSRQDSPSARRWPRGVIR